jgi:squalene-hopene/tetraprenyl-beta-curcumene cyclase
MRAFRTIGVAVAIGAAASIATTASALDEAHYRTARQLIEKSIDYLRAQQDETTGGWSVNPDGPNLPAITGLVVTGMLMEPDIDATDPAVAGAVEYMLSFRQPDGGIYDRILANYNTALCLSALARVNQPEAAAAIPPAHAFLKGIQWSEDSIEHPETGAVDPSHPFYGGVGYGGSSRPDNSNLNLMLQGLRDSGLSCDDEAFQRALVFLERTQMHGDLNDMPYAEGSTQGGFIYATSPNGDDIGAGESKAGMIDETLSDGTTASRLRAYGSMTYAGFKSYIYADLDRDDPRVRLAYDWIRRNYTLEENPGVGMQGYYYYLVTFSRALDAWGLPTIETAHPDGATAEVRDWANDLIDRLAELQNGDGSFENLHDRWMEGDPVLVTAYALLALQHAIN